MAEEDLRPGSEMWARALLANSMTTLECLPEAIDRVRGQRILLKSERAAVFAIQQAHAKRTV